MPHKDNTARQDDNTDLHTQVRDLIDNKDYTAARSMLLNALKEHKTAAAYCDLGEVCSYMGNADEATINFENAIKLDPKCHKAYACIAELLIVHGHALHAIDYYALAIKAAPEERRYIDSFLAIAMRLRIQAFNKDLKDLYTRFLMKEDVDVSNTSRLWYMLLCKDPSFKDFFKVTKKSGDNLYPLFCKAVTKNRKALLDPYFLNGIQAMIVPAVHFETLLTLLRRFMLEQRDAEKPIFSEEDYITITRALAGNCMLTEYIFNFTDEEENAVAQLKAAAESAPKADEKLLTILACYTPLVRLSNAATIAAQLKDFPQRETRLFAAVHLEDYLEQRKIRQNIPAITEISVGVSAQVQEQYEEFPYPRWTGYSSIMTDEKVEGRFKDTKARILNAGCGTGQEAIGLAATFPDSDLLAVDLSLTSIAYGAKRAQDTDIKNIKFKHGDILGLGVLDEQFDYIASAGVLHHMEDPAAGLAVLTGLLKPDGLMRLGLYSETARRFIAESRKLIKDKGFKSDATDIRRFRREAPDILEKEALDNLAGMRDYFSLSECRDLLFHVQEHRFTIPQLKEFLAAQNLEFVKFYIREETIENYRKEYPEDEEASNLDNWHEFEQNNPDTFIEMYRFWCHKKPL